MVENREGHPEGTIQVRSKTMEQAKWSIRFARMEDLPCDIQLEFV